MVNRVKRVTRDRWALLESLVYKVRKVTLVLLALLVELVKKEQEDFLVMKEFRAPLGEMDNLV